MHDKHVLIGRFLNPDIKVLSLTQVNIAVATNLVVVTVLYA